MGKSGVGLRGEAPTRHGKEGPTAAQDVADPVADILKLAGPEE